MIWLIQIARKKEITRNAEKISTVLKVGIRVFYRLLLYNQILSPTAHFFGCCIVNPELPTLNHVWGIYKLFFPSYNIKFGVLE